MWQAQQPDKPPPPSCLCLQVPTCSGDFKQALVALLDDVKAGRLQRPKQQQQQQQQGVKGADAASLPAADAEEAALAGMGALACR